MSERQRIAAIILAAGTSSRMENRRHKLLLPLGDRPVIAHVLAAALASQVEFIVVVLGHQAEQVRAALSSYTIEKPLLLLENSHYKQGMSSSLRIGLQVLLQQNSAAATIAATFVLLGDQPLITPHLIDTLIAARTATGKQIIAPLYNGKRGNPVLFDAQLFAELTTVTGDEGGRSIIERHPQDIATVEMDDIMTQSDVDTWSAYERVLAAWDTRGLQEEAQKHDGSSR